MCAIDRNAAPRLGACAASSYLFQLSSWPAGGAGPRRFDGVLPNKGPSALKYLLGTPKLRLGLLFTYTF